MAVFHVAAGGQRRHEVGDEERRARLCVFKRERERERERDEVGEEERKMGLTLGSLTLYPNFNGPNLKEKMNQRLRLNRNFQKRKEKV